MGKFSIKKRICPVHIPDLDSRVTVLTPYGKASPELVLTLRGFYDSTHDKSFLDDIDIANITDVDIQKFSKELQEFYNEVQQEDIKHYQSIILESNSEIVNSVLRIKSKYNTVELMDRIELITDAVQNVLDKLIHDNNLQGLSYEQIISNYYSDISKLFADNNKNSTTYNYNVAAELEALANIYYEKAAELEAAILSKLSNKYTAYDFETGDYIQDFAQEIDKWPEYIQMMNYYNIAEDLNNLITSQEGFELYKSLVLISLIDIRDVLGIKIDPEFSFAEESNTIHITEEGFSSLYEEVKRDSWQENQDTISSFNRLDKGIRKLLSRVPIISDSSTNTLLRNKYCDAGRLYRLIKITTSGYVTQEQFLSMLKEQSKINPELEFVVDKLEKNPSLLSKMAVEFKLTNTTYKQVSHSDKSTARIINLTGRYSNKNTVFKSYLGRVRSHLNNKSIFKQTRKNNRFSITVDKEKYTKFQEYVTELMKPKEEASSFLQILAKKSVPYNRKSRKDKCNILRKCFDYLDISYSEELLTELVASKADKKLMGLFYKIADEHPITDFNKDITESLRDEINGIPFIENTLVKILNIVEAQEEHGPVHHVWYLGNKMFNDILPSTLSNIVDYFKSFDFTESKGYEAFKAFLDASYFKSSQFKKGDKIYNRLLSDMYQDEKHWESGTKVIESLALARVLGTSDKKFVDFTSSEHANTLMLDFFQRISIPTTIITVTEEEYSELAAKDKLVQGVSYHIKGKPYYYKSRHSTQPFSRNNYASYSTFILGDNNQLRTIDLPVYSYEECIDALYDLVISEINYYKLKDAKNKELKNQGLSTIRNDKVFGFIENLNNVPELKDIYNLKDYTPVKEIIVKEIEKFISEEVKTLLENTELHESVKLLIDTKFINNKNEENRIKEATKYYVANYAVALGNIQQISIISPTLFEGSKDMQKRNKGILANGKELVTNVFNSFTKTLMSKEDAIQKVVIFKDIKLRANIYQEAFEDYVKKILKGNASQYLKAISLTDGQGYRNIDSYFKIKCMLNEDTPECVNWYSTYKRLQEKLKSEGQGRTTFNVEEIAELEATGYFPQPLKPLTQAITEEQVGNDTLFIAQQHKYAEIVLIPEMLEDGTPLKAIANAMTGNDRGSNIDLFIASTGVKVGSYAEVTIHDDNGVFDSSTLEGVLKDHISKHVHKVDLKYMKMQTNLPMHIEEMRGIGTQLKKIVAQSIVLNKIYSDYYKSFQSAKQKDVKTIKISKSREIETDKMSGQNLVDLLNAVQIANYIDSFKEYAKLMKDLPKLSKILVKSIFMNNRGNFNDILTYRLKEDFSGFYYPLFESIKEQDTSGSILSIFRKTVNKQTMYGGSFVQASAYGITKVEEDKDLKYIFNSNGDITGVEAESVWNLSYTDNYGNTIPIKYEDYCHENGELKTNSKGEILLDIDYPGIRDMITYRIPTEEFYSLLNIKIVKFSRPSSSGGIIRVPLQATAQAGFDFDADKLYFLRRQFKESKPYFSRLKLTYEERDQIISKIMEEFPEAISEVEPLEQDAFSQEQLNQIFTRIYEEFDGIREDLKAIRNNSNDFKPGRNSSGKEIMVPTRALNYYWEKSKEVAEWAKKYGYTDLKAFKQHLVNWAANDLGLTPSERVVVKKGYFKLNDEAIKKAGFTKIELFKYAAKELKIPLVESKVDSKFTQYDPSKTPLQNSKIDRNNLFFDIIKKRMEDPETAFKRLTTGGFEDAKSSARRMRHLKYNTTKCKNAKSIEDLVKIDKENKDPEEAHSSISVNTLIYYNRMNQIADKLIGVFANHNSNASMSNLMKSLKLKEPILFGSFLNNPTLLRNGRVIHTKDVGRDLLADTLIDAKTGKEYDIAKAIRQLLNASVDAVKDPVLDDLGITLFNATIAATLARLGYSFDDIGLLFNHPVIKRICYSTTPELEIYKLHAKFEKDRTTATQGYVTEEMLIQAITNPEDRTLSDDMAVFELFLKARAASNAVNDFVLITKNTASASISSNFASIYETQFKLQRAIQRFSSNSSMLEIIPSDATEVPMTDNLDLNSEDSEEYMDKILITPYAIEQAAYDCNKGVLKACSNLYPYETPLYKKLRSKIRSIALRDLSEDTIAQIHKAIQLYTLANRGKSYFNSGLKINDTTTLKDYITKDFPELIDFYKTLHNISELERNTTFSDIEPEVWEIADSPLFDILTTYRDTDDNGVTHIRIKVTSIKNELDKNKGIISTVFEEAFNNPITANICNNIILYHYFTNNFNFNSSSFAEIFSPVVLTLLKVNEEGERYLDVINKLLESTVEIDESYFEVLFVANNVDNEELVDRRFIDDSIPAIGGIIQDTFNKFTIPYSKAVSKSLKFAIKNPQSNEASVVSKYIMVENKLYKATSNILAYGESLIYDRINLFDTIFRESDYSDGTADIITDNSILKTEEEMRRVAELAAERLEETSSDRSKDQPTITREYVEEVLDRNMKIGEINYRNLEMTYAVVSDERIQYGKTEKSIVIDRLFKEYEQKGRIYVVEQFNENGPIYIELC